MTRMRLSDRNSFHTGVTVTETAMAAVTGRGDVTVTVTLAPLAVPPVATSIMQAP